MVRQHRSLTLLLLTCALFLRIWVPAGWMPSADGKAFTIEPCAAAGSMVMDPVGKASHDRSHKAQHEGDCPFAPYHSAVAESSPPPVFHAPAVPQSIVAQPATATIFATGPPSPPPPARAPPAIA